MSTDDIHRASRRAQETFRYFWRELSWERQRIVPAFDLACVKVPFTEGKVTEHMWVDEVSFDGSRITGVLINEPNELRAVSTGDAVDVPLAQVEDWMLASDETVLGAFTVHAIRAAMKRADREQHDAAWGLPFGDAARPRLPPDDDDHPMALNAADKLVAYLREDPARIRTADARGFTLLHTHALAGNANIVAILLEHGADAKARTKAKKTPLALARSLGWSRVIALLDAGAGATPARSAAHYSRPVAQPRRRPPRRP
jgi:uncharacterized protein